MEDLASVYVQRYVHHHRQGRGENPHLSRAGEDPVREEFGEATIPMLAHDNTFGWADMYPPMPEAYYTFDNLNSYGPEGHPANRKIREVLL